VIHDTDVTLNSEIKSRNIILNQEEIHTDIRIHARSIRLFLKRNKTRNKICSIVLGVVFVCCVSCERRTRREDVVCNMNVMRKLNRFSSEDRIRVISFIHSTKFKSDKNVISDEINTFISITRERISSNFDFVFLIPIPLHFHFDTTASVVGEISRSGSNRVVVDNKMMDAIN
jgi:hypothetical protein